MLTEWHLARRSYALAENGCAAMAALHAASPAAWSPRAMWLAARLLYKAAIPVGTKARESAAPWAYTFAAGSNDPARCSVTWVSRATRNPPPPRRASSRRTCFVQCVALLFGGDECFHMLECSQARCCVWIPAQRFLPYANCVRESSCRGAKGHCEHSSLAAT